MTSIKTDCGLVVDFDRQADLSPVCPVQHRTDRCVADTSAAGERRDPHRHEFDRAGVDRVGADHARRNSAPPDGHVERNVDDLSTAAVRAAG